MEAHGSTITGSRQVHRPVGESQFRRTAVDRVFHDSETIDLRRNL
jgi:hypothetical protein